MSECPGEQAGAFLCAVRVYGGKAIMITISFPGDGDHLGGDAGGGRGAMTSIARTSGVRVGAAREGIEHSAGRGSGGSCAFNPSPTLSVSGNARIGSTGPQCPVFARKPIIAWGHNTDHFGSVLPECDRVSAIGEMAQVGAMTSIARTRNR